MKKNLLFLFTFITTVAWCQKSIQSLQPTKLAIFKNGTYFIKKSGDVKVQNKGFTLNAPQNVLMGSYWLSTANNATIKSIKVKLDTFKVETKPESLENYYKALIGKQVTFYERWVNKEIVTGTLLMFNPKTQLIKYKSKEGKVFVTKLSEYDKLSFDGTGDETFIDQQVEPLATVALNENVNTTTANTLSLHTGMQWVASYLLTIINDKEAKLTFKATLITGKDAYKNTDVDIIVGNPEMFYGNTLDPIAIGYLSTALGSTTFASQMINSSYNYSLSSNRENGTNEEEGYDKEPEPEYDEKKGEKVEDLYIYKLGKLDLDANAKTIIPIKTFNLTYEDIYTIFLPTNSAVANNESIFEVEHKYRINNSSDAPLTTGPILVINQNDMPLSQDELKYTPTNGKQSVKLSKAIDVQVSNEETETKREKSTKKAKNGELYEKVSFKGTVQVQNLQKKKIKLSIIKNVAGVVADTSNDGKIKKAKDVGTQTNSLSIITWEVELLPGQKLDLTYNYNALEK
jgi:hypothetical protein